MAVWRACAEGASEEDIARVSGVDPVRCLEALDGLVEVGLIESSRGVSRRSALATVARVGAAGVVGAPVISALIPVAAAHASTGNPASGGTPPTPAPVSVRFEAEALAAGGTFVNGYFERAQPDARASGGAYAVLRMSLGMMPQLCS